MTQTRSNSLQQPPAPNGFEPLPASACWKHGELQIGFETSFFRPEKQGWLLSGSTSGIEDGVAWVVDYELVVDSRWRTRLAVIRNRSESGTRSIRLESEGDGVWSLDGSPVPQLDGCFDVDLESSAMTNMLPVHRLALDVEDRADAPAAYVRAVDLRVERLEQVYSRIENERGLQRFEYLSVDDDFRSTLRYDSSGLVLDYPGIAVRFA